MDISTAITYYETLNRQNYKHAGIEAACDLLASYIKQEVEKSTQSPSKNPTTPITQS